MSLKAGFLMACLVLALTLIALMVLDEDDDDSGWGEPPAGGTT